MHSMDYRFRYRTVSVRRKRRWLVIGTRIGLALWTVALWAGLLLPGSGSSPESAHQANSGTAVAASVGIARPQGSRGDLVALNALRELSEMRLPKATPLAYLNSTRFPVDGRGRLLSPEAIQRRRDLPIVTCANAEVDPDRNQVATSEVLEALHFLAVSQQTSLPLYCRISQVAIDPKLGIVLYLEDVGVPVLVGKGHVKRKVAYLATVLRHLDTDQGLAHVRFLDLRLEGQVVARMERGS
ncbi:MAG: cell division protein FtsQ [candidate division KSB1 bacterium]|nr:cell division protein FtsQ [candidate division KSB1 bacterium]MDZ7294464.1 cell division protein FtsQ [candidate division KSB1 bacterium]MDZ7386237.1 cell division protein FtsQ [candidate division KSB1 bacterium]MDZ7393632.1 cell division protein FtsQ [candidate division KSB1 bacterium]MDZ7413680.1 cell division protein FtsQ [candidate division KSB1 bacterium]